MPPLYDLIGVFTGDLKKRGFRDSGPVMGRAGKLWSKDQKRIVTVGPLKISPQIARKCGNSPSQSHREFLREAMDAILRDLLKDLMRLSNERNTPVDLIFPGGGSVPLPDWFRGAVAEMGFRIFFLYDDDEFPRESEGSSQDERSVTIGKYMDRHLGD